MSGAVRCSSKVIYVMQIDPLPGRGISSKHRLDFGGCQRNSSCPSDAFHGSSVRCLVALGTLCPFWLNTSVIKWNASWPTIIWGPCFDGNDELGLGLTIRKRRFTLTPPQARPQTPGRSLKSLAVFEIRGKSESPMIWGALCKGSLFGTY